MAKNATEDARKANCTPQTVLAAVREIQDYQDKVTTASGLLRNRRKYWKAEGVNLTQLDAILALKRMDEADVMAEERDRRQYAQWLNVDLEGQAAFEFQQPDPEVKDELAQYDAMRDGRNFGMRGEGPEFNPHMAGTIAHVAWETGRSDNFNADAKKKVSTPRKAKKGSGAEMGPDSETAGNA